MESEREVISAVNELRRLKVDQANTSQLVIQKVGFLTKNSQTLLDLLGNEVRQAELQLADKLLRILRLYCIDQSRTVKTFTFRLLSHLVRNKEISIGLNKYGVDYFISRAIETEGQVQERKEAFKICNNLVGHNCQYFPKCLIFSLYSIAKQPGEPYCLVALEMMTAIASKNPRLCAETGSIQVLFNSLHLPSFKELHKPITQVLLSLLDPPLQRKTILPHVDISMLLSPLTEPFPKHRPEILEVMNERWKQCTETCMYVLKSWEGLISLTSHPYGLTSYLNALALPNMPIRQHLVYSLFEIFRIPIPKSEYMVAKAVTVRKVRSALRDHDLVDSYVAAALFVFVHLGLIPALVKLGVEIADSPEAAECLVGCAPLGTAVTILLSEILNLSIRLLPTKTCAELEMLPLLVKQSVDFDPNMSSTADPIFREKSQVMIDNLHNLAHEKMKLENLAQKDRTRMKEARRQVYVDMDDFTLKNKMQETQIFTIKNSQAWNWDIILDLLSGPLSVSAMCAQTAIKAGFIKQLVSFYSPSRGHFSEESAQGERAAIQTKSFEILIDFLQQHAKEELADLVSELAHMLASDVEAEKNGGKPVDKKGATTASESFFSKKRVQKLLVREYFNTFLGHLTKYPAANDLLQNHGIFESLTDMIMKYKRNDLCDILLHAFEYNTKETQNMFGTISSRNPVLCLMSLNHLRQLLMKEKSMISHSWLMTTLLEKLVEHSSTVEVVTLVLDIIDEALELPECLNTLIALDKTPLKRQRGGKSILFKLLVDPKGFDVLLSENYLNAEYDEWMKTENSEYAKKLHNRMSVAATHWTTTKVPLPPHLLGELAKTPQGCSFLIKKNVIATITKELFQSPEASWEQQAAMWALASIMCCPIANVCKLIPNIPEIVKFFITTAETSLTLSFRGIAFYIVGLISVQKEIREIIEQNDWEAAGADRLIAFPKDFKKSNLFCLTTTTEVDSSEAKTTEKDLTYFIIDYKKNNFFDLDKTQIEILFLVEKLVNLVKQDECNGRLQKMHSRDPSAFTNAKTLLIIYKLMENFKFTIKERQFLHNLFEKVDRTDLLSNLDKLNSDKMKAGVAK